MADVPGAADAPAAALPPVKKKGVRGRSATPLRGRSMTPLQRHREKSATPSGTGVAPWRSITPFLNRDEKEKTPFELGPNLLLQLASYQAIFDKALVMDISGIEEPRAKYITSDNCVVDKATLMDISNVEYIYIEEDEPEATAATATTAAAPAPKAFTPKPWAPKVPVPKAPLPPKPTSSTSATSVSTTTATDSGEPVSGEEPKKKRKLKKRKKKVEGEEGEEKPKKKLTKKQRLIAEKKARIEAEKKAKLEAIAKAKAEAEARKKAEEEAERLRKEAEEEAERIRLEEEALALAEEEAFEEQMDEEAHSSDEEDAGTASEEDMKEPSPDNFVRPSLDHGKWEELTEEEQDEIRAKYEERKEKKIAYRQKYLDFQRAREEARNPHVTVHLRDTAQPEGKTAKLSCGVSGPGLVIKWYRDGHLIERSPKYKILVSEGLCGLEIINPLPSDSGEYACRLHNDNGDAGTSCILTIYDVIKKAPMPPTFTLIRDHYRTVEDILIIEAHVTGTPRPTVTWLRDCVVLRPSFKYMPLEGAHGVFRLEVYRPNNKDTGKYTICAKNKVAVEEVQYNVRFIRKLLNCYLHEKPKEIGFYEKKKEEARVLDTEEAALVREQHHYCKISGYPLPFSKKKKLLEKEDTPPPYVPPPLKIACHLRDRIGLVGESKQLICAISGDEPEIEWLKDGNPIEYGKHINMINTDGVTTLTFDKLSLDMTAVYKCVARAKLPEVVEVPVEAKKPGDEEEEVKVEEVVPPPREEVSTSCYLRVYEAKIRHQEKESPIFLLGIKGKFLHNIIAVLKIPNEMYFHSRLLSSVRKRSGDQLQGGWQPAPDHRLVQERRADHAQRAHPAGREHRGRLRVGHQQSDARRQRNLPLPGDEQNRHLRNGTRGLLPAGLAADQSARIHR